MNHWIRQDRGPVTILSLNRPPINTLDRESLDELTGIVDELDADKESRVIVITGAITGVFCSGGDLKYWRHIRDAGEVSRAGSDVFERIERLSKPTLAAINGHVVGDGLALALACDLRIAADSASFRLPEVAYGFIPGWGLIHRLVAVAGRANAAELLLAGKPAGAVKARSMGLISETVAPDELMDRAVDRALELATRSPAALRAAKCALLGDDETKCFESVWGGTEWHTGIDALLSKRIPVYGSE